MPSGSAPPTPAHWRFAWASPPAAPPTLSEYDLKIARSLFLERASALAPPAGARGTPVAGAAAPAPAGRSEGWATAERTAVEGADAVRPHALPVDELERLLIELALGVGVGALAAQRAWRHAARSLPGGATSGASVAPRSPTEAALSFDAGPAPRAYEGAAPQPADADADAVGSAAAAPARAAAGASDADVSETAGAEAAEEGGGAAAAGGEGGGGADGRQGGEAARGDGEDEAAPAHAPPAAASPRGAAALDGRGPATEAGLPRTGAAPGGRRGMQIELHAFEEWYSRAVWPLLWAAIVRVPSPPSSARSGATTSGASAASRASTAAPEPQQSPVPQSPEQQPRMSPAELLVGGVGEVADFAPLATPGSERERVDRIARGFCTGVDHTLLALSDVLELLRALHGGRAQLQARGAAGTPLGTMAVAARRELGLDADRDGRVQRAAFVRWWCGRGVWAERAARHAVRAGGAPASAYEQAVAQLARAVQAVPDSGHDELADVERARALFERRARAERGRSPLRAARAPRLHEPRARAPLSLPMSQLEPLVAELAAEWGLTPAEHQRAAGEGAAQRAGGALPPATWARRRALWLSARAALGSETELRSEAAPEAARVHELDFALWCARAARLRCAREHAARPRRGFVCVRRARRRAGPRGGRSDASSRLDARPAPSLHRGRALGPCSDAARAPSLRPPGRARVAEKPPKKPPCGAQGCAPCAAGGKAASVPRAAVRPTARAARRGARRDATADRRRFSHRALALAGRASGRA